MRILGVFEKSERIRHIGHLDIQRSVQRALRRSGLPVAYSNGFNPHILISFASALSTGACGLREIMDVKMAEQVSSDEFLAKMAAAMPEPMPIKDAVVLEDHYPALPTLVRAAQYDLLIRDADTVRRLERALPVMMEKDSIPAMRKTKTALKECDIKPMLYRTEMQDDHIRCEMVLNEREACKPGMLMEALCREAGIDGEVRYLVTRTALLGETESKERIPLERLPEWNG